MFTIIIVVQSSIFLFFFTLERIIPARQINRATAFLSVWLIINIYAAVWVKVLMGYYVPTSGPVNFGLNPVQAGLFFYFMYSFVAYWYHRLRHSNKYLWRFIHKFHHSTPHMETAVAFYKHPTEYMLNSVIVLSLGWFFSIPIEAVAMALAIEGALECFHHSNICIPKKYDWIGWVVQTPKMHLIHHEYGLHRYNYATFFWDTAFGTARISKKCTKRLGFETSSNTYRHLFLKK